MGWPGAGVGGVRVTARFGLESGVYTRSRVLSADSVGLDSAVIAGLYPDAVNYLRLEADNGSGTVETAEFTIDVGPCRPGMIMIIK